MPINLNIRLNIRRILPFVMSLCIIIFAACSHVGPAPQSKMDWTTAGTGAFHSDNSPVFQGVGSAEKMRQISLLRATADNRAKTQLFGLLQQYMNALTQFAGIRLDDLESRQAAGTIVQQSLQQAAVSEHWFDETNNKIFSRCSVTLDAVKQLISISNLKETDRYDLLTAADQVFEAFVQPQ